ncbi:MAG: hypothetical protein WD533_01930, partial [Dehalococcoidia bacterium]
YMTKVNILTPGFATAGGTAFLTPIHRFANALARLDIEWHVFADAAPGLGDCDVLLLDSESFRGMSEDQAGAQLDALKSQASRLVWVDTGVSTGMLQNWVFPHVDFYWKGQALRDRNLYLRPMYGGAYFTDYYHHYLGVEDESGKVWPGIADVAYLRKIRVFWNAAFVDHSLPEPAWAGPSKGNGKRPPVTAPRLLRKAGADRPVGISARLGRDYPQATLNFQRERIKSLLAGKFPTEPIGRAEYLEEIQDAKAVVSPFGIGEITPRDFETFMAGALLVKPVMNIVDTWPALYTENFTFWTHNWRVDHLDFLVQSIVDEYHKLVEVAQLGQDRYFEAVKGRRAAAQFAKRFKRLLTE